MSAVLAETRNAFAEAARELARPGAGRRRCGWWHSSQRCSPQRCSRCPAGWPISPASSTSRSPRSASRTPLGSPGSRRSGKAPSSASALRRGDLAREGRLAAAAVASRRSRRRGRLRRAHRDRDRAAPRRVRRSQHVDPQLDRSADADLVPRHLGRSAGARDARGERPRPHAHADYSLRDRRHAGRIGGARLRRARPSPGRASRSRPAGTRSTRRSASEFRSRAFGSERSRPRR